MDFGLENAKGLFCVVEDKVLLARGASWSDKEVFFFFLFLLLLSEVGVGGASGIEFEVVQCMENFLWIFCLGVLMLNLVLLVSVKYTSTMVDSGVAISVLCPVTASKILFYNLI